MPFATLAKAIMTMRNERMAEELSSNANLDVHHMMITLAGTLYEQIRGPTPFDVAMTPGLFWEISGPAKLAAITSLMSRLESALEAL